MLQIKSLESTIKGNESEISRLTLQLSRREEVINTLSEREALRNAEMDKLAQIAKLKDDEMLSMDMQDPATSVLCIKCKKSLDDMSNIRSALMGDTAPRERFTCESYRLLLPNLRGKKPHRSNLWIRACVRSILLCKMKEDSALLAVRGDISRFPGYVYSWFTRSTEGLVGANLMKALVQCDEDRWGLFYGLKALAKEDSECAVFWSLLDEAFGQDGLQYLLYCLSVAITIAPALWGQLGASMITNSSVDVKAEDDKKVKPAIWMELTLAKQATHMILVKALAPQVVNALEAIDAVRSRPKDLSDSKEATHINLFTWLRLMLQQLQADQIHRNAAIRLMFETASVGAMTPGPTGSGAVTSGIHVEYPQFQSICQTLFPFLSVNSIADFYTVCVVNKRVTADIFTTEADLKGYFSYALRLAPLPLMRNIQDMMSGATEPDGQVGEIVPPAYAKQTSIIIRSKLAALIHRKLVAITPAVRFMCRSLPERWRVLLTDATAAVHTALTDTYNKLKEIYMEQLTLGSLFVAKEETVCFLDGILPYVAYRRLVSLAVYVKSVTENPLLPCEIFTTSMGGNYLQALFHAEKLINHLESSLLLPLQVSSSASHTAGGAIVTKHAKFESVRKALIARKIQLTIRKFLSKDVPVPRSVRFLMTAGYLSSNRTQGINQPLKTREVYHEPWWAQGHVAAIYLFKINHDARAVRLGLPCLPLCHAVAAYHYFLWGSIDIAERAIHDLFISIRAYRMNLPRLRLFAAFLGDGKDLDDAITKMLTSPQAIAVYFHLLFDLHKEQRKYEDRMRAAADGDLPLVRQHTVAAVNGRKEMTSDILEIECLYPSNEDSFQRSERKESFMVDLSVCQAVAQRFASSQPWLKGKTSIYTDLPERLRSDSQGRLDVDDFLYIVLMQWAKLAHYHILRCTNRTAVFEQTLTADNGHVLNIDTSALIVNATVDSSTLLKSAIKGNAPEPPARQGAITRRISMMPLSNIKSIVESIYRPGEAADLADPLHYACSYIHCIRSRRNNIQKYDIAPEDDEEVRGELSVGVANGQMPTAKFWDARCGAEMSVLLKDCVMWDTNLGIFQPETTAAAAAGNAGAKLSRSNTPKTKNPMVSADDGHLTVFIHTQPVKIYNAVFPEIALATAKSAFASYQSPFNSLLNRIAEDPKFSNNLEVRARIQSLRIHLLSLTDFFQTIDLHYVSPKLHTLSLLYVDDKDSEELSVYRIEKAKSTLLAADAQVKVQSLMSSIAELVVSASCSLLLLLLLTVVLDDDPAGLPKGPLVGWKQAAAGARLRLLHSHQECSHLGLQGQCLFLGFGIITNEIVRQSTNPVGCRVAGGFRGCVMCVAHKKRYLQC